MDDRIFFEKSWIFFFKTRFTRGNFVFSFEMNGLVDSKHNQAEVSFQLNAREAEHCVISQAA